MAQSLRFQFSIPFFAAAVLGLGMGGCGSDDERVLSPERPGGVSPTPEPSPAALNWTAVSLATQFCPPGMIYIPSCRAPSEYVVDNQGQYRLDDPVLSGSIGEDRLLQLDETVDAVKSLAGEELTCETVNFLRPVREETLTIQLEGRSGTVVYSIANSPGQICQRGDHPAIQRLHDGMTQLRGQAGTQVR